MSLSSTSASSSTVKSCLNILRRTPPQDVEQNLTALLSLLEEDENSSEELLQRVDVGLRSMVDPKAEKNKEFIICDHNRDGESYRSPWTNQYYYVNKDGDCKEEEGLWKPSERLRNLEKHANEVFDSYRKLYYGKDGSSVSSVYLWDNTNFSNDKDQQQGSSFSFSGCFLIQNQIKNTTKNIYKASWNSTHVVDVTIISGNEQKKALYKLTTTVQLSILPHLGNNSDTTNHVGGSLTRQTEKVCPIPSNDNENDIIHIIHIGKMLEDMETDMRSNMDVLYLQKTREIVDCMYSKEIKNRGATSTINKQHTMLLNQALLARNQRKS